MRKLVDCCSRSNRRINGDAALEGYCFAGRKVFCVMYFQTKVPVLSGLEIALAAAAFLIGLTGTWSPCGFSMVETIGPAGHTGGRRTTVAACATFAPGAVVGGIVTFGALAALGGLVHGAGGTLAYVVAAAIAVVAAVARRAARRSCPRSAASSPSTGAG